MVAHKFELAALIRADAVGWRLAAMRPQLPPYLRPLPLLLARPEVSYQPGRCLSCGDQMFALRCEPCKEAVRLLLENWQAVPNARVKAEP